MLAKQYFLLNQEYNSFLVANPEYKRALDDYKKKKIKKSKIGTEYVGNVTDNLEGQYQNLNFLLVSEALKKRKELEEKLQNAKTPEERAHALDSLQKLDQIEKGIGHKP